MAVVGKSKREEALEKAIERFGSYLLWYFKSLCGDEHEAENRLQELWVHVYEKFPLDYICHAGMLKRKAWQIYVDWARKKGVRDFVSFTDEIPDAEANAFHQEASTEEEEKALQGRFWENFPGVDLTDVQMQCFWLKCRQGYTLEEISEQLNVPRSTAQEWIKLVKVKCATYLKEGQP